MSFLKIPNHFLKCHFLKCYFLKCHFFKCHLLKSFFKKSFFKMSFFNTTPKLWQRLHHTLPVQKSDASTKFYYEMPESYRNSFYLANASFFDNTNWFVHRGYEVLFPELVEDLQKRDPSFDDVKASKRVRGIIKSMDLCNELLDIIFPVKKEGDRVEMLRGYRAHHGLSFLSRPCLGGLQLSSSIRKDHCKALSVLSTYRNTCVGINLGGAHGGIKMSTPSFKSGEIKEALEKYARELARHNFCGSEVDIIEPDMYCGEKEMSWISNAFEGETNTCAVNKPITCGKCGYEKANAEGMYIILDYFLQNDKFMKQIELPPNIIGKTFAIQGLGKIGIPLARLLEKNGAKCVGVKELDSYLYDRNGISVEAIASYKIKHNSIKNFDERVKPYDNNEMFKENFDILILAANHKSVMCFLADHIKAKVVVEVANGAITPSANKILIGRNKLVLPDIVVNSGSSLTSYLEYVKNVGDKPERFIESGNTQLKIALEKSDVNSGPDNIMNVLKPIVLNTVEEVLDIMEKYKLGLDLRTAAYINSIGKIFKNIYDSKKF